MRVYLGNCVLNRPFDDQSDSNVRLETIASLFILDLIEKDQIELVTSSVVKYENSKNPFIERRIWISNYLAKAHFYQELNTKIKQRAQEITEYNIFPLDALHLASAEAAQVDYLVTNDYDIIKRYKGTMKVVDPINFIQIFRKRK